MDPWGPILYDSRAEPDLEPPQFTHNHKCTLVAATEPQGRCAPQYQG